MALRTGWLWNRTFSLVMYLSPGIRCWSVDLGNLEYEAGGLVKGAGMEVQPSSQKE